MRKYLFLPLLFLASWLSAQSLDGAWKMVLQNGKPVTDQEYIKIYQDDYFAFGVKNTA